MKPKSPQEQAAASRQVDLLANALQNSRNNFGIWLNADGKSIAKIHDRKTAVSPFNAMILGLFSDSKGYPTNRFTSFSDARQRGDSVMKGELGVPFLFYKWDKYVNRGNKDDVIDREAYKALDSEAQKAYRAVRQREVRTLFNISQTTLPYTDREGFARLVKDFGPVSERVPKDAQDASARRDVNRFVTAVKENLVPIRRDTAGFARYDMEKDAVYMPDQKSYPEYQDYFKDLVSRVVAATGHSQRLSREGVTTNSEDSVLRERLVNDLATGIKLHELGFQAKLSPESEQYVDKWCTQLREDPCLIYAIESDVNNALAMIAKAEKGEKIELATDANKRQTQEARDVNRPQVSPAEALILQDILAHGGMGIDQRNFPGDENKSTADMKEFMEKFSNLSYYRDQVCLAIWNGQKFTKDPDPEHPDLANVAYTAAAGEAARIYEKCSEWLPKEWEQKGSHFVADEAVKVPDRKSKEFVVVLDKETGIADVILPGSARTGGDVVMPNGDKHNYWLTPDEVMLPEERREAGAKAVSHNLPGFNKEKISAALMAQGASYVRFYNTDGLLRYRPDDAYFANKSVYAARLNGKEVNVTANFDVSDAVHRATHQIFDRQQMLRADDGKWLLYMKPEDQTGFAVEPSKEDVNRFFTAVKSGDQARTREVRDELAQKYYAEAVANPGMKQDIFTLAPDDVDLSLIDRVNIFRTKDDKIVCLATIQGVKGLQPMEMTKPQWEKMWIADDVKAYKNQIAGLLYADTLRQVAVQRQEATAKEKESEEQKKADEAKRQDEARRKAEEQKRKEEEAKREKKPDPITEAVGRGVAATIALSLLTQYDEMKKKHPDAVLLFRKGDDYVVVKDDAPKASEILGIPLKQEESEGKSCDYATFRHHDLDTYLPKLVRAGERVAICEQLEDPALKKGDRVERGSGQAMASEPTSDYKVIGSVPGIKQDSNRDNEAHVGFHR